MTLYHVIVSYGDQPLPEILTYRNESEAIDQFRKTIINFIGDGDEEMLDVYVKDCIFSLDEEIVMHLLESEVI